MSTPPTAASMPMTSTGCRAARDPRPAFVSAAEVEMMVDCVGKGVEAALG